MSQMEGSSSIIRIFGLLFNFSSLSRRWQRPLRCRQLFCSQKAAVLETGLPGGDILNRQLTAATPAKLTEYDFTTILKNSFRMMICQVAG